MNHVRKITLAVALALATATTAGQAAAQDHSGHAGHGGHQEQARPAGHAPPAASPAATPVAALTDADRAAAFPEVAHAMEHGDGVNSYLLLNRLEAWDAGHGSGQGWEAEGWVGTDLDRLWLRSEGERGGGSTEAADLELLYGRSVSPWWDVVAGLRHDFAPGDSQAWVAFGVQGLAPYMFEVALTGYVGGSGRTALEAEIEYELLLTNRLVLQPTLEATAHGQDDAARGVGAGLSSVEAGLRLRYEFHRQFAPYVGVVHERAFGDSAELRAAAGHAPRDTRIVAGIRIWF